MFPYVLRAGHLHEGPHSGQLYFSWGDSHSKNELGRLTTDLVETDNSCLGKKDPEWALGLIFLRMWSRIWSISRACGSSRSESFRKGVLNRNCVRLHWNSYCDVTHFPMCGLPLGVAVCVRWSHVDSSCSVWTCSGEQLSPALSQHRTGHNLVGAGDEWSWLLQNVQGNSREPSFPTIPFTPEWARCRGKVRWGGQGYTPS